MSKKLSTLNKCECGRTPTLRKAHYETSETRQVERREQVEVAPGVFEVKTYLVHEKVPKLDATHYVQCPNIHCRKHTDRYNNKTKAVNAWNEGNITQLEEGESNE